LNSEGRIGLPSFFGLFVDSLAMEAGHLYCFLHTQEENNAIDYWVKAENVTLITLGADAPAYIKTFLPNRFLSDEIKKVAALCDKLIVRGPSPLLHHFRNIVNPRKITYFIIGSYNEGLKYTDGIWYRRQIIKIFLKYINRKQISATKGAEVIVNSKALFDYYEKTAGRVGLVYTTTLKKSDLYIREDTCHYDVIRLMFVGRFDWAKGIRELLKAFQLTLKEYPSAELHFVGWEDSFTKPVQTEIENWRDRNDLNKKLFFHGKKTAGEELLSFYRSGDLYILPTYHEGFPRTVWEAMASSLPVITTTVGSIPDFLTHKKHAYLIPPHNEIALLNAILELISDKKLRQTLIKNGLVRVEEITLEEQAKKLLKFIANE
jgi:glycosyltransferase involved in cell wall biosynthesis